MPRFNSFLVGFLLYSFVMICITMFVLHSIPPKSRALVDMRAFYASGQMLREGVKENLYNPSEQQVWRKKIFHNLSSFIADPFLNPPFVAALFIPLSFFSYTDAYTIVACINTGIVLLCIYFFMKERYSIELQKKYTFLFIIILFYFPIILAICEGQLSFFLLSGIIFSWYAFKRQKSFLAGVFLGLLLVKPHVVLLPVLLLLWKKQWKAFLGFCSIVAALFLISLSLVGWGGFVNYLHMLLYAPSAGESYSQFPQTEATLRGFLQLLAHTDSFSAITVPFTIGLVITAIIFFFSWKGTWDAKNKIFDFQWSILVTAIVFTSIHTNYYDLALLIVPFVILLQSIHNKLLFYSTGMIIDAVIFSFFPQPSYLAPFVAGLLVFLCIKLYKANGYLINTGKNI